MYSEITKLQNTLPVSICIGNTSIMFLFIYDLWCGFIQQTSIFFSLQVKNIFVRIAQAHLLHRNPVCQTNTKLLFPLFPDYLQRIYQPYKGSASKGRERMSSMVYGSGIYWRNPALYHHQGNYYPSLMRTLSSPTCSWYLEKFILSNRVKAASLAADIAEDFIHESVCNDAF